MDEPIVIIGAGQAGGWAAHTLRDSGYDGRLVLVGDELHPPYQRPPLSKELLLEKVTVESTYLFPADLWSTSQVELLSGPKADKINRGNRRIHLSDGRLLPYSKVLIATGGRPRRIKVPGAHLAGIHYLRTISDSLALAEQLESGGRLLVVGGGWIGLEVAAAARQRGLDVVIVEAADHLCRRAIDRRLAEYIGIVHRDRGTKIKLGCGVTRFLGDARVSRAELTDGTSINISVAVIGVGMAPNIELAVDADLAIQNGIRVDAFGRTSASDIFAAGDVASYPNDRLGRRIRPESWENAQNQAVHVAKAMIGKTDTPFTPIPWFWSDQYDLNIQLAGTLVEHDHVIVRGKQGSSSFTMCYMKDGELQGAAAINRPREIRILRRLIQARKPVEACLLEDESVHLDSLLRQSG